MLKKLFIKNYNKTSDSKVRNNYGIVAGIFGIISNIVLGLLKVLIGYLTNSVTIIADAVNNITDTIASTLTVTGFKMAGKKPSEEHPYGYARYEYVANLFVSLFVLVMGAFFAKESVLKILNPEVITISTITYVVLIVAILVKMVQVYVYLDFSKAIKSATLKATATDSINDIITTSAILISMIIMSLFNVNIDGLIGLFVSLFIVYNACWMLKDAINPLIGIMPTKEQVESIKNKIMSYESVLGVHDLIIHNYGINYDFVTVHVEIDDKMSFTKAHQIADNIEEDFYNDLNINITVHMDPIEINNKETNAIKDIVLSHLNKLDKHIEIHDFRVIKNKNTIKVLFDLVEPFDKDYELNFVTKYLTNKMESKDSKYIFIIKIDRPLS